MQVRRSPFLPLGSFLVALVVAACADALGSGQPAPNQSLLARDLLTTSADSVPPDTSPPPPPDSSGRAMIRGLVTGIDSTVVPPRFAPVPRAVVTLFAIVRTPRDSSDSTQVPPRFDSIAVTMTDRAGFFFFSGLRQRQYALRAMAPARLGFAPGGTRARAVLADDSTQVPITNVYLHRNPR